MDPNLISGFLFVIAGAICGGSFGLPSKFAAEDSPWESLWGPFFFFATILIPVTLGPWMVDGLFATCREAGWSGIALPLAFGFLWGLGSMTLGMSFAFIGLSLAYAINYGAQIAFGSMAPMLLHNAEQVPTTRGYVIMAGVAVCLLGVVVCGRAGVLKSRSFEQADPEASRQQSGKRKPKMLIGLALAFISGILCACYAVAFSYGGDAMEVSQKSFGNEEWRSTFVVTALILWGGAVSSCLYCAFQLSKNGTWGRLARPGAGRLLLLAAVMACLHDGAILCWGVGVSYLDLSDVGVPVGYAVFMSFAIIVGNVNGFLTREWKGASRESVAWILAGIAVLIIGVCVLAKGQMMPKDDEQPPAAEAKVGSHELPADG